MTKPIEITKEAEAIASRERDGENSRQFWAGCSRADEEKPQGYWVQVALNAERAKAIKECAALFRNTRAPLHKTLEEKAILSLLPAEAAEKEGE